VRFFSGKDFSHPMGLVKGSLSIAKVKERFIRAQSVVLGPEARLVAYAEPGFRDELATFEPRQHVPDLREIGFARRVASLKITCAKPQ
jgi:hypothetical protein